MMKINSMKSRGYCAYKQKVKGLLPLGFLWGMSLVLFITFVWAYFFNNMVFSINLNSMGEATFELIFVGFCLFLAT